VFGSLWGAVSPHSKLVLDVGCGYSILPSFLKMKNLQVCAIDVSKKALTFQHNRGIQAVQASAEKLPFRQKICDVVISISVLEHIPGDGDTMAIGELSKLLKDEGSLIISLPFGKKSRIETDFLWGIPPIFRMILKNIGIKRVIFKIFEVFGIERGERVFMRIYDSREISSRILRSLQLNCDLYIFGNKLNQIIYKIVPMTLLSWIEYQLVKHIKLEQEFQDRSTSTDKAIILKFASA